MAFQEANVNGAYDGVIKAGQGFLKSMQWDESEGKGKDDPFYGGAGYGGNNSRPDLSNTAFFMDALRDTGLPADDPDLQKALVFVSRCQNLKSEFNDQPWAGKVNDGGFVYTAANGGSSVAGTDARRRPPLVRQHDLRRPQEHDLRRPDPRRPPRQGGRRPTSPRTTRSTRTPASASWACTTTTRPSPSALAMVGKPTLVDASGGPTTGAPS